MPLQPGPYRNLKFRLTAALVGASCIVFRGFFSTIYYAITLPGFYIAFAISFLIALLMVYCVHRATIWLDSRFGWWEYTFVRSVMQIVFGLCLPLLADLLFISIYFDIKGQNILTNGFLNIDFPYIFLFILILNLYYVIYYLVNVIRNLSSAPKEQIPEYGNTQTNVIVEQAIEVIHNGVSIYYILAEVLCFYTSGGKTRVLTADKKNYAFSEPLSGLEKRYSVAGFIRISKGTLINMVIVRSYTTGPARDNLTIQVKQKYEGPVRSLTDGQLTVTKEFIEKVKSFFSEG